MKKNKESMLNIRTYPAIKEAVEKVADLDEKTPTAWVNEIIVKALKKRGIKVNY